MGRTGRFQGACGVFGFGRQRLCTWHHSHRGWGMDGTVKNNLYMQIRFEHSPKEVSTMNTAELREAFLTDNLMQDDAIRLLYTHYDRVIMGGAKPVGKKLVLETHSELKAAFFLERRELGMINVGGKGKVSADGQSQDLNKLDAYYIGKGVKEVVFESADAQDPAMF